jgi:TPP-dependent pyruvate/acetoin dehydrogenase alpha subunit
MRIEVSKRIKAGEHPLAPFTLRLVVDGFDVKAALIMLERALEEVKASAPPAMAEASCSRRKGGAGG